MRDWPDKCIDLILTDPPYNVNLGANQHSSERIKLYDKHNDNLTDTAYRFWVSKIIAECLRLANNVIITPGNKNQYLYPVPKWTLSWVKMNSLTMSPLTRGVKINKSCWEPILVYGKLDNPPFFDVINHPISVQKDAGQHPTPKPLKLFYGLIKYINGQIILDPFCGSGTTCVAAKMLGRSYIGIDISEKYCEIARQRLEAVEKGITVKELKAGQQTLFGKEK